MKLLLIRTEKVTGQSAEWHNVLSVTRNKLLAEWRVAKKCIFRFKRYRCGCLRYLSIWTLSLKANSGYLLQISREVIKL